MPVLTLKMLQSPLLKIDKNAPISTFNLTSPANKVELKPHVKKGSYTKVDLTFLRGECQNGDKKRIDY